MKYQRKPGLDLTCVFSRSPVAIVLPTNCTEAIRSSWPSFTTYTAPASCARSPFEDRDLRFAEALGVIVLFDLPPALFDGVGIQRIADLQAVLLAQRLVTDIAVAQVLDVLDRRPLGHLERDEHALGRLLGERADVAEPARRSQPAHVGLDHFRIELAIFASLQLRLDELLFGRLVARHAYAGHQNSRLIRHRCRRRRLLSVAQARQLTQACSQQPDPADPCGMRFMRVDAFHSLLRPQVTTMG